MASLNIFVFFLLAMLLFLAESNAGIVATPVEATPPSQPNANNSFKNAVLVAQTDAPAHTTRSHACSSARSAVPNACVCLLELMETKRCARAITTGRPKEEAPNAHESLNFCN
ncbi:hypothetical protein VNO77_15293 [Canavalia gladiata]|uniref:Uncharacterized protein n=1 Tax=Canavalia gladiata TaxID=3824 RepID=A0AAN9M469_CANGL